MKTDIGEYIVGAYLKIIKECDFVDYNVRLPGGGLEGLNELDVVGLDFKNKIAYICEVTTHIRGLLYKDNKTTVKKIKTKYKRQKEYANKHLSDFPDRYFMFWSPVVPKGYITNELEKINGLGLVINEGYTQCVDELRKKAKELTNDMGNPFFRMLQILEHLKGFEFSKAKQSDTVEKNKHLVPQGNTDNHSSYPDHLQLTGHIRTLSQSAPDGWARREIIIKQDASTGYPRIRDKIRLIDTDGESYELSFIGGANVSSYTCLGQPGRLKKWFLKHYPKDKVVEDEVFLHATGRSPNEFKIWTSIEMKPM